MIKEFEADVIKPTDNMKITTIVNFDYFYYKIFIKDRLTIKGLRKKQTESGFSITLSK